MALIEFLQVEKKYRSRAGLEITAVAEFNLHIDQGEFFCLLGPSGCGKTTMLGMLAGFEAPSSGRILLDGATITEASHDRGVIFQGDDSLYPWLTALENVEFGLRVRGVSRTKRRETARRYLELVGLTGHEDKYPLELSGGMKQRIQIARVLANEPKMLLMDEPFAALDAQTRATMQRELRRIWQVTNISVFFITHDIDEAIALASRVGIMTPGPGTLREVIVIDMAGERSRVDPRHVQFYGRIQKALAGEADSATTGAWAAQ
jgi:NitT/TauT family transport system ATP-binding protein